MKPKGAFERFRKAVSQLLQPDDTVVLMSLVVGLFLLLVIFRPKNQDGRNQAGRAVPRGPEGALTPGAGRIVSYDGWKILVCLDAVKAASSEGFRIDESQIEILKRLAQDCDLHLVNIVTSDEEAEAMEAEIARVGLYDCGLKRHKVIVCDTLVGKQAVARQLSPSIQVESDPEVVKYIAAHIPYLGYITPDSPAFTLRDNTRNAPSLSSYLNALVPPQTDSAAQPEAPTAS
eukprot:TRINITY_DN39493_c0_g1_i1.p1 TRINITY_DN39493_c0_g1~~TRINITY_DN39493_c0_g1_i1.p1  ORF type:complete len:232 (+),score=83.05 TRINITY_DN39493_c0_g1_i1:178-873(+)